MATKLPRGEALMTYISVSQTPASRYVLQHGSWFKPQPLPKGFRRRAAKNCYGNAGSLVLEGRAPFYVEGFAVDASGFSVQHAWAATEDRAVIDATWPEPEACHYFGVAFTLQQFSALMLDRARWGLFADGQVPAELVAK